MKKFTFVLAATALCANVGFAQTVRHLTLSEAPNEIAIKKVEKKADLARFDFVKENQRHIAKSTAQVAALEAPVALPATNVTDAGFTANWNAVSGANAYQPSVMRAFSTTSDVQYVALLEDFSGAKASTSEYSGYLDEYCYRWDWFMYGGKLGNQSLVFPATSSVGVTQLVTPYFDLTCGANEGSTASVSLFIEAEGTVGDSLTIGFLYVDQTTQQEMAYLIESIPFETAQMSGQYTIDMFPVYSQMGFILQTNTALGNSGDVTLKKFIVSRPVSAGSQFASSYDYRMLTGATSADFNTMEKSLSEGVTDQFIYGVYALTLDMQQQQVTDASEVSNLIEVTSTSGVEGVQASNDKIFVHDNLHVVLEKPATIAVYNMAGVLVMSVEGVEGENEIALPAAGAYIVKAGNTVAKVMK